MKWFGVFISANLIFLAIFLAGGFNAIASSVQTGVVTREPVLTLTQSGYRWYANINSLTPTTALAGENSTTTTPSAGTILRLRMNILDEELALGTGATFNLQYATSTSGPWIDLSTSTAWIFADNSGIADGAVVVDAVLSDSDVGESYGESNPSAASPVAINPGEKGEWDWVIRNSSANTASGWFFRMIFSSSTLLGAYARYPQLSALVEEEPEEPVTPGPGSGGGGGGTGFYKPPFPLGVPTTTPPFPIPPPFIAPPLQRVDCNADNHIDIVDLSIMLFYYGQPPPFPPCVDLNLNGKVDFPDVSILMFYWTGA